MEVLFKPSMPRLGQKVPNVRGIQHSKVIRVGPWFLAGSCNWSTSSRCNIEMDTLIELHSDRVAREKELILLGNAVRQEREDITGGIGTFASEAA